MLFVRNVRKINGRLVLCRAVVICTIVLALLLARNFPPSCPQAFSRTTVNHRLQQDHRQCFDPEDIQWIKPATTASYDLAPAGSDRLAYASKPFPELPSHGLYYNRPPPLR